MTGNASSAGTAQGRHWLCDLLFLLFAASYAFLACAGIETVSGMGVHLDSDLETYAQGMAGERHPEFFGADPVLHNISPANSIPNAERMLAGLLAPGDAYALGFLRAGAIAIFVFYAGWYILGRWLYESPALAASLSLLCGITVWVGWGTFWGVTHSDPIPRVFFAAAFPFLLLLALFSAKRPWLRPLAMLACGLGMWIHGVSALNCGAMFFLAFVFSKPEDADMAAHLANCALCLAAFLLPVLVFLWPSLSQKKSFSADEMRVFMEVFSLRWQADYSGFGKRLISFLSPDGIIFYILAGGAGAWLVSRTKGNKREKILCGMCPAFCCALILVVIFCWAETRFSPMFGRVPMGHELVRGLRFLIPLAWLLIVAAFGCGLGVWPRRMVFTILATCIALFTVDRQYAAAQYALSQITGVSLPLSAQAGLWKKNADDYREFLEDVKRAVPPGEAIFSPEDCMAIRHYAMRPLAHAFKDGYVFFYNKDQESCANWLRRERMARDGPEGLIGAWRDSGAPWLLCRMCEDKAALMRAGDIVLEKNGWLLLRESQP